MTTTPAIIPPTPEEWREAKAAMDSVKNRMIAWSEEKEKSGVLPPGAGGVIIDKGSYTTQFARRHALIFGDLYDVVEYAWNCELDIKKVFQGMDVQSRAPIGYLFNLSVSVDASLEKPTRIYIVFAHDSTDYKKVEASSLIGAREIIEEWMGTTLKLPDGYWWEPGVGHEEGEAMLYVIGPEGYSEPAPAAEGSLERCRLNAWCHYSGSLISSGKLPEHYGIEYHEDRDGEEGYFVTSPRMDGRGDPIVECFSTMVEAVGVAWDCELDPKKVFYDMDIEIRPAVECLVDLFAVVDQKLEDPTKIYVRFSDGADAQKVKVSGLGEARSTIDDWMETKLRLPDGYKWVVNGWHSSTKPNVLYVRGPEGYSDRVPIQEGSVENCRVAAWDDYSVELVKRGKLPSCYHLRYLVDEDWEERYWVRSSKTTKAAPFGSLGEAVDAAWDDFLKTEISNVEIALCGDFDPESDSPQLFSVLDSRGAMIEHAIGLDKLLTAYGSDTNELRDEIHAHRNTKQHVVALKAQLEEAQSEIERMKMDAAASREMGQINGEQLAELRDLIISINYGEVAPPKMSHQDLLDVLRGTGKAANAWRDHVRSQPVGYPGGPAGKGGG